MDYILNGKQMSRADRYTIETLGVPSLNLMERAAEGCVQVMTEKNLDLSRRRAQAVESYLKSCGVSGKQIKKTSGFGEQNPVADNSTEVGRQQNRRVEIYMYASEQMIKEAQAASAN